MRSPSGLKATLEIAPFVPCERENFLARCGFPDPQAAVVPPTRHALAVSAEGETPDALVVPRVSHDGRARLDIPNSGSLIPFVAARDDPSAVWAEDDAVDTSGVSSQRSQEGTGLGIVKCHVSAARHGQYFPIGALGHPAPQAIIGQHEPAVAQHRDQLRGGPVRIAAAGQGQERIGMSSRLRPSKTRWRS